MIKEKKCKCCKEYWWETNIHTPSGLCPNCYDYVVDLEAKLAEIQNEKDELISKYRYWKGECAELKHQLAEKDAKITYLAKQVKNI